METAPFPMAKALIEDYRLEDSAAGCTLHWTGGVWPVGPAALMRPILSASLTLIITRLSRGLQATASQTR